jgi:hypothetical protein
MDAKQLLEALNAYYIELMKLGAEREAVAIKEFAKRVLK